MNRQEFFRLQAITCGKTHILRPDNCLGTLPSLT
jgi:hypothetical protein